MRILMVAAMLMAGCTSNADTGEEHAIRPDLTDSGIVLGKGCSTTEFGESALIGRRAESIPFAGFPFPVRIVKPGMAVTMDYSAERLTVETDENGLILRYACT